jgi:transposase
MFLKVKSRTKDGKTHRYWSIVESRRVHGGRMIHRQLLYLGELNDAQHAGWIRTIEAFDASPDAAAAPRQLALFPEDREAPAALACEAVHVRLDQITLCRPRQWGACWLALHLWDVLELDRFWAPLLPQSRKGTRWLNVLKALVAYRLIDPGSEFRFHREWFLSTALGDLLGEDFALAQKDKPYRCLDLLVAHKESLFDFLKQRWGELFGVHYDVLLYDLTSTYFESDPPLPGSKSKKKFGYSRDHRSDCVQVVIALVVTPEGLPLAYEVYPGNTRDTATLAAFLDKIEARFGKARRTWLMDRGIPTEETLEAMRGRGIQYLVGTPKGRLNKLEAALLTQPWSQARQSVAVKMLPQEGEFYVYVESRDRVAKERSMRRRRLKHLWRTLKDLRLRKRLTRDELLMALGAARKEAGRAWGLVMVRLPEAAKKANEKPRQGAVRAKAGEKKTAPSATQAAATETVEDARPHEPAVSKSNANAAEFAFELNRDKLRRARQREGRYLLRSNMRATAPETVWENYMVLARIEQAFKDLKGDLKVRPIWHQIEKRIEAHIFVSFLAYGLHTTLRNLARGVAGGLTTAAIVEKFAAMQMIDVHLPTTDGRRIVLSRYTQPETEVALLLAQLRLTLPAQPPPRVEANGAVKV